MMQVDFYQHQSYWGRVVANLGAWLQLPHLTTLDTIILLPLFPLLIIAIIVWAPWEPWVWKNVPKTITGPYLLYCAFAFWHFHAHWWLVSVFAVAGCVVCAIALKKIHYRGKVWHRLEP